MSIASSADVRTHDELSYSRPETGRETAAVQDAWSPATRVLFRFFFSLTVVFSLIREVPELLDRLPVPQRATQLWDALIPWPVWKQIVRVTQFLFHLSAPSARDGGPPRMPPAHLGGAANTRLLWSGVLALILLSAVVTVVWTYADRRRTQYVKLHEATRIYLRFALAVFLVDYGIFKVLLNQGDIATAPSTLLTPFGMMPPEQLPFLILASPVYQIFAGMAELLGGVLLVFRRTQRVGAFVALAASLNVAALNIAYHMAGMSILSVSMVLMALWLTAPDLRRLFDVLVLERAVPAPKTRRLFVGTRFDRAAQLCGAFFLCAELAYLLHAQLITGAHWRGRPPLYGAYNVESFVRGRDTLPPLLTDAARWRQVAIDPSADPKMRTGNAYATIITGRSQQHLAFRVDSVARLITVVAFSGKTTSSWSYSLPDRERIVLATAANDPLMNPGNARPRGQSVNPPLSSGDSIRVTLRRIDLNQMPLLK